MYADQKVVLEKQRFVTYFHYFLISYKYSCLAFSISFVYTCSTNHGSADFANASSGANHVTNLCFAYSIIFLYFNIIAIVTNGKCMLTKK